MSIAIEIRFSILFKPTILSIHRECMQWNSWEHAQSAMLIIIYFPSATAIASLSLIIASTLIYHLSFTCQVHNEILMFIFSHCGIFSLPKIYFWCSDKHMSENSLKKRLRKLTKRHQTHTSCMFVRLSEKIAKQEKEK